MTEHLISLMLVLPFLGAFFQAAAPEVAFLKNRGTGLSRAVALLTSIGSGLLGVALVASLNSADPALQLNEQIHWIGSYSISYDLGLDGINSPLVLLISLGFPLLVASEWDRKDGVRGIQGLLLMLQSALLGAVCSQDMFLLFFFWSLSSLPLYFLIGIWGGENREQAAFRTIVASAVGNALLFAALVLIYYAVEPHSFSLRELSGGILDNKTLEVFGRDVSLSKVAFGLIALGLAFRAPVWPLHGWFTLAAQEAPPSVLAALSAAVVPVATGIFLRLSYSLFPATVNTVSDMVVFVGSLSLLMGGLCAVAQRGLRLLMAFFTVSEVGLILMGIGSLTSAGAVGAIYHQLVVGLALTGFGLFIGVMNERSGHVEFRTQDGQPTMGGVSYRSPTLAVIAALIIASLLGIPGLGGFVGHSLLLVGTYELHPFAVILAGVAFLMATYYLMTMYRFVFFGNMAGSQALSEDLRLQERGTLVPLVFFLLFFGVYPKPLIELIRPSAAVLLSSIQGGAPTTPTSAPFQDAIAPEPSVEQPAPAAPASAGATVGAPGEELKTEGGQ